MRQLDLACYSLCLISILGAAGVIILGIWGGMERESCLKVLASLGVLATACLLVLGLNRFEKLGPDNKP